MDGLTEAFLEEGRKLAASKGRMAVPQTRQGRRSMSVETLLRKDKEGTLFKKTAEEICWGSVVDEYTKLATGVSLEEADAAMGRLHRLEKNKQSKSEIARGAVAGTGLGVAGNLLSTTIQGTRRPLAGLPRQIAGAAVPGMLIGAALPAVKQHMNEEAEKEKLRVNLGLSGSHPIRSKVRQVLGV